MGGRPGCRAEGRCASGLVSGARGWVTWGSRSTGSPTITEPPHTRRCLFVHGYDPLGPRRYRPLFAASAARWGEREGVRVFVERTADGLTLRTHETACRVTFLRWDHVVRRTWPRGWRMAPRSLRATARLVLSGSAWRHARRARPLALATVLLPALHFGGRALAATSAAPTALLTLLGAGAGWLAVPLAGLAMAGLARFHARPGDVRWVAAGTAHDATSERADPLEADGTRAALAAALSTALEEGAGEGTGKGADEALVVAHSMGCRVAVSLVADCLRRDPGRRVRLLTLGASSTVLAAMRGANWFRDDLAVLSRAPALEWVDVSSPVDPINAAAIDPVRDAFGPVMGDIPNGARTFNAWFRAGHDEREYAAARRDPQALHFMFLAVPARPDPRTLDLFDMLLRPGPALARYRRPEETGPFYAAPDPPRPLPPASAVPEPVSSA